jgi:hypothetical protein
MRRQIGADALDLGILGNVVSMFTEWGFHEWRGEEAERGTEKV